MLELVAPRIGTWIAARSAKPIAALASMHVAALGLLAVTESFGFSLLVALFAWVFFNASWVIVFARPLIAAGLSLVCLVLLVMLSRFKHEILLMTVNMVDLMLVDVDTVLFLLNVFPQLGFKAFGAAVLVVLALCLLWRGDPFRVPRSIAGAIAGGAFAVTVALSVSVPSDPWNEFYAENYFSKYVRSGVTVTEDLLSRGILQSDGPLIERLVSPPPPCQLEQPPHIILIHDESSFDARAIPGIKVPAGYGDYFKSGDGARRKLLVEGPGGPSWYTEYNMLTGLSGRTFGRFIDFATRIAAGRVERGLPRSLVHCGYKTFTLYPMYGSFLSAERFQRTAGIQHFLDSKHLGATFLDPDAFYFNKAVETIARHRDGGTPLFLLVYTAQNHFPWSFRYRPDLATGWRDPGNRADVDEYLRRQHLTEIDYQAFLLRLKRDFPQERFLIVRFGDHQPYFARNLIDPKQDDSMTVRAVAAFDPRFLATYYAIDTINFTPRDTTNAIDQLDAPHLPLVIQELAGVPLDPSFAEQRKILQRCKGLFYRCSGGAEARRFNRLLIDAGLIKGL